MTEKRRIDLLNSYGDIKRQEEILGEMLTAEAAARKLKLTVRTLTRWRKDGHGPAWIRLGPAPRAGRRGGAIRYPAKKLDEWLAGRGEEKK